MSLFSEVRSNPMWRTLQKQLRDLPEVDPDELLELIGLEQRRSTAERAVPTAAIFGVGLLVGVGVGLFLAQQPVTKRIKPAAVSE